MSIHSKWTVPAVVSALIAAIAVVATLIATARGPSDPMATGSANDVDVASLLQDKTIEYLGDTVDRTTFAVEAGDERGKPVRTADFAGASWVELRAATPGEGEIRLFVSSSGSDAQGPSGADFCEGAGQRLSRYEECSFTDLEDGRIQIVTYEVSRSAFGDLWEAVEADAVPDTSAEEGGKEFRFVRQVRVIEPGAAAVSSMEIVYAASRGEADEETDVRTEDLVALASDRELAQATPSP